MTDQYAVIGHPIAHSKSPLIHAEFAKQCGQDLHYDRILAPLDGFESAVLAFFAQGGKGLNVTLPFKQQAWKLAASLSLRAADAEAVNTLSLSGDGLAGDNTDGAGLVRDISARCAIGRKRVLLMGAGGAARGVIRPLLEAGASGIVIANRTMDKAEALAERFGIDALGYPDLADQAFDIVINATSSSLSEEVPPLPAGVFAPGALAYDMMYGKEPTAFLRFAAEHGAGMVCDGLGMLVEQAAESFFIWRGIRPDTAPVIAKLRSC